MDILTHTISGLAAGTVVASFANRDFTNKIKIILLSGFGGALPDIDAISLWSKFDATIGKFFNLPYPGKYIYSAKLWYSHHAFFHSLFAGILIALLIGIACFFISTRFKEINFRSLINNLQLNKLLLVGFLSGFIIHLFEDMPTPASSWGGVNFFWPLKSYTGGTGQIWWWNNYDIFLIAFSVFAVNFIVLLTKRLIRFDLRKITAVIFMIGLVFSMIQINTRKYDFAYSGNTDKYRTFEIKSKELQKEILGENLYNLMEKFDKKLIVHF